MLSPPVWGPLILHPQLHVQPTEPIPTVPAWDGDTKKLGEATASPGTWLQMLSTHQSVSGGMVGLL